MSNGHCALLPTIAAPAQPQIEAIAEQDPQAAVRIDSAEGSDASLTAGLT